MTVRFRLRRNLCVTRQLLRRASLFCGLLFYRLGLGLGLVACCRQLPPSYESCRGVVHDTTLC